jgi:phosphoribosylformylglycinamidine cyclo-ligase
MVTGQERRPGDAVIGLPSSGIHSNGYTLARRALLQDAGWGLDDRPPQLEGASVADVLLEPTVIYVRAVLDLLGSEVPVRALAHITGGGVTNLLRFPGEAGWELDAPLAPQPVFRAIAEAADVPPAEMHDVFNMGCGFVAVVPAEHEARATEILGARHPGTARIGTVTDRPGIVELPGLGLAATRARGVYSLSV